MRKLFTFKSLWGICLTFLIVVASCKKDEPSTGDEEQLRDITVLLYAVVSDLNLESDKREILQGATDIDLKQNKLYIYQVYKKGEPELLELTRDDLGAPEFKVVKTYDRELYSTDPARISDVINEVMDISRSKEYGLIFWSHGTGWSPAFSDHGGTRTDFSGLTLPSVSSFGSDTDTERDPSYTDKTDIDELARAIPDNIFSYIWFDVCYMGGIETVYQLKDKCEYFIGMPTEDAGNGMPYNLTLPYLLKKNPDCVAAAKEFFNYYETGQDSGWAVATVGVYRTSEIEGVANYCRTAYSGAVTPSSYGLQVYSRGKNGPFYDFGQYTRRMASSKEAEPDPEEFVAAMDKFVIYKAATKYDFANREIIPENYSGLSCHLYNPESNDKATEFYRTLDWFKRVYE